MGSPAFSFNRENGKKVLKGLIIALLGAALTYLTEQIPNIDFGNWTPLVVAGWSAVVNAVRQWIMDNR